MRFEGSFTILQVFRPQLCGILAFFIRTLHHFSSGKDHGPKERGEEDLGLYFPFLGLEPLEVSSPRSPGSWTDCLMEGKGSFLSFATPHSDSAEVSKKGMNSKTSL